MPSAAPLQLLFSFADADAASARAPLFSILMRGVSLADTDFLSSFITALLFSRRFISRSLSFFLRRHAYLTPLELRSIIYALIRDY